MRGMLSRSIAATTTVKIDEETDLRSDLLLGSDVLYHVDLSFIFILKPRYFFLSCRSP